MFGSVRNFFGKIRSLPGFTPFPAFFLPSSKPTVVKAVACLRLFLLFFLVVSLFIITDSYKAVAEEGGGAQVPEKVTIAYNVGNPPLKFADSDGRAAGILIDLWRLWSEKSGVEVEFREAVFSKTLDMVKNGEADVHAGLFYTRERDRFLDYSEPLMDISYHIFHRKGLPSIDIIGDSIPYRIGVPKGYTHTFVQENQPNGAIALYENFPALYDAAVAEEIVVFLSPPINFEYYLQTRGLRNNFRYNPAKPVYRRIYLGAVAEGKKALLDTVNKGFARISQEERVAIERRWLKRSRGQTSQDQYVIACDSDYAPFTMLNVQGEPAGLFVAIWKKWAEYENVKVDFLFDDWNGSIEAVKEGLADFHAGFEADQSWQLSSSPFYRLSAKVFVPVENGINTMEDLRGRSVAAIDPFYGEILKDHPSGSHIQTINVHNYSELFNKLSTKEVDAFIDDELVVENLLLRQGRQGEFGSLPDFSYSSAISAVTRKENISLVELVNKGLNRISHEDYLLMENRWLKDSADGYYHGAGSQVELTEEESRWLQEHPVLRIGVDQGYAPYAFVDGNGNFSGIAADFTKLISDLLGIKMEMVPGLSWPDILQGAEDKTLDVLTTASWRPERESFLNFSEGYIPTPLAIMSRKGDQSIRSKNDLVGKRVALVTEYTTSKMVLTDFPDLEVLSVTTPLEGLQAVATGRVDAYVGVLGINIYQANKNGIYNLKVAASYSQVNNIIQRYGVRKDWPQLAVIIDKALATISEKEKLAIFDRWIPVGEAQRLTRPTVVLNREEQKFIEEHPTIRLGFDPEFFPFEFRGNDGSYSGIASDYITILRQRLGLNIEIVPDLSWKEAVKKIKTREIDMLPCIGKTGAREEYLAFSKPYINFQRVVIARSDFPFIGRLDDLSPFQVAVQENSSHAGFIRDNTKITPVEYPTLQDSLRAVSNREVDAFIGNLSSATYWIRKLNLTNLKVAAPAQVEKQNLYFGVRKDWPQLADIINKGLASISTDEETAIYRKWVSVKYEPGLAPGVLKEYILKIVSVSIFCLLIFLVWNYKLKREVSQRKEAERQLQHYTAELETANSHLKSLDRLKSMFIASMSHELRTPLNSIIGFTGVILQGMAGEINERQHDQLSRVYRSAKHLLSLISDVIDISKIEAGRIDVFPTEFMLHEVIEEAVENIQPQLEKKGLSLSVVVSRDLSLTTDRMRLLQALINYLSNGVKYTEVGGVTLEAASRDGRVEVSVSDTGIGISEEDIAHLFEAFERLESHIRVKAGGTGLGLYLTKKIITELLQGEVAVESRVGEGSKFSFSIPQRIEITKENQD